MTRKQVWTATFNAWVVGTTKMHDASWFAARADEALAEFDKRFPPPPAHDVLVTADGIKKHLQPGHALRSLQS